MALWQFSNLNKYGTLRKRIIYLPDGKPFSYNPKGLGKFVATRRFKYKYEHPVLPPHLFVGQDGQKYIIPTWQEVVPETTLADIEWVKPEIGKAKLKKNEWLFESKSDPGHFYKVTQVGVTYRCNCPGVWRAKDRECKHIKTVKNEKR
jgi:hypothetical protein